ncbi:MAG: hypothetical protein LBT23_11270 [Synergistaceae bacterium]|jgi:hypothetical protein|nr:hypothetical protein [Synergistaceae bacterium]
MTKKLLFSRIEYPSLAELAIYYSDACASLKHYFKGIEEGSIEPIDPALIGANKQEFDTVLSLRIEEAKHYSSLALLAFIEAKFRCHYIDIINYRKKGPFLKIYKNLYYEKKNKVSLEEDIFKIWEKVNMNSKHLTQRLKGAFKYRHWLAHGRYWSPHFGQPNYEYFDIYQMAQETQQMIDGGKEVA